MPWCNRTLIIVADFGTIVEVVLGKSFKDCRIALRELERGLLLIFDLLMC